MQLLIVFFLLALEKISAAPVVFNTTTLLAAHKAPQITNNPTNIVYRADFPFFNSPNVIGIVQFYSLNGTTKVHVDVKGLPKKSGPFSYHIHENGIPYDSPDRLNACEAAGLHFNPFKAPLAKNVNCDSFGDDSQCQVGDLSGKHGLINTTCFETYYYDHYLSLNPSDPAFIGGKSLVIHFENLTMVACANIVPSSEPEDLELFAVDSKENKVRDYVAAENTDSDTTHGFGARFINKRNQIPGSVAALDWGFSAASTNQKQTTNSVPLNLQKLSTNNLLKDNVADLNVQNKQSVDWDDEDDLDWQNDQDMDWQDEQELDWQDDLDWEDDPEIDWQDGEYIAWQDNKKDNLFDGKTQAFSVGAASTFAQTNSSDSNSTFPHTNSSNSNITFVIKNSLNGNLSVGRNNSLFNSTDIFLNSSSNAVAPKTMLLHFIWLVFFSVVMALS